MRYINWFLCVATVTAIGTSAVLYTEIHPKWWAGAAAPVVVKPQKVITKTPVSDSVSEEARRAAAWRVLREANDQFLTGDRQGRAEWNAPVVFDDDQYPTICGVTPDGRYMIVRNEIGSTRYDEPVHGGIEFGNQWMKTGCEKTSPLNQNSLLEDKYQEDIYNLTHPINNDCLIARIHNSANNLPDKGVDDPHYCQDGSYERDQATGVGAPTESPAQ